ncbi:MAG: hypothetical protein LBQ61_08560, partial [Spirochaetales bacterium]|nr:hypothetical protein [Spirochaetales bacterium]
MMTVNKLAGLPPSTRLRKAAAMLREWAFWIAGGFQETAAPSQGPPQGREPGQLVLLLQEVSRWAKVP